MKGIILNLEWDSGDYLSSSNGCKKETINNGMKKADVVVNHGYGNFKVVIFSKYWANIQLEDGSIKRVDIKREIKESLKIKTMSKKKRCIIESFLPIEIEYIDSYNFNVLTKELCNKIN